MKSVHVFDVYSLRHSDVALTAGIANPPQRQRLYCLHRVYIAAAVCARLF